MLIKIERLIKSKKEQKEIINYLQNRINKIKKEKGKTINNLNKEKEDKINESKNEN